MSGQGVAAPACSAEGESSAARQRYEGWSEVALMEHIETKALLWQERKKQALNKKLAWELRRENLAKDVLWKLHSTIYPGFMIYRPPGIFTCKMLGEKAKDERGVTIDMFHNFHRSAHTSDLRRFFTDRGGCVLPCTDAAAKHLKPLALPFEPASGSSGSSSQPQPQPQPPPPPHPKRQRRGGATAPTTSAVPTPVVGDPTPGPISCDAPTFFRLCGRLLALSLTLGEDFVVDDRYPLYVLEYLATDNFIMLDDPEVALQQLGSIDPTYAAMLRRYRSEDPRKTLDELGIDELQECDLYPQWQPSAKCSKASGGGGASSCTCAVLTAEALRPENRANGPIQDPVYRVVREVLVSSRIDNLMELARGFQGNDNMVPDPADRAGRDVSAYNFTAHLSAIPPERIGLILRGVPLSGSEQLAELLREMTPEDLDHPISEEAPPVDAGTRRQMMEWFRTTVHGFTDAECELFLIFVTGKKTLSHLRASNADVGDPNLVNVWVYDGRAEEQEGTYEGALRMTASTCARTVYLPYVKNMSQEELSEKVVRKALEIFQITRNLMPSGAALDYE